MPASVPKPAPQALPVGREHYHLKQKLSPVEMMLPYLERQLDNAKFVKYLEAQYDEHAITGKVVLDRDRAVTMVMTDVAQESPLHQEKQSTLIQVMTRGMRKFIRKEADEAVSETDEDAPE